MEQWPTVHSLSQANLEDVNKMWSGLGYYSRGRRLLEGAKKIQDEFDGDFPNTSKKMLKEIPGVGR